MPEKTRHHVLIALAVVAIFLSGCATPRPQGYPIGIYSVPQNDLPEVRQAGFNFVSGTAKAEYLKAAETNGIRVLGQFPMDANQIRSSSNSIQLLKILDRYPALWSWYVIDEPDLNHIPPEEVEGLNSWYKVYAKKPTTVVLSNGSEARHYSKFPDILAIDRYPVPWIALANFSQHVRQAKIAAGSKPLLVVIQAFDWAAYPELMQGAKVAFRTPTFSELRSMVYSSLAEGANGIFFYTFHESRWKIREHPQLWNDLKTIVSEIRRREPLFSEEALWSTIDISYRNDAAGWNEALQSSVTVRLFDVQKGSTDLPAGKYILAVNTTDRKLDFTIRWDLLPRTLNAFGEGRALRVRNQSFQDSIDGYGVHVYGPMK